MHVSRRFGSVVAVLLLCGATAAGVYCTRSGPSGVVMITPDQDDTLVYVDGTFMGAAGSKEPLQVRLAPGPHDIRLSCQSRPDLLGRIDVLMNKKSIVRAVLPTVDALLVPPATPPPVGLGQTLRIALQPATKTGITKWSYRLPGKEGDRVLLVVADRKEAIDLAIVDEATNAVVAHAPLTETDGLDGREFREFTHVADGAAIITVWSIGTKGVNPLALRICKSPPPMLANTPKVGRRAPPAELR